MPPPPPSLGLGLGLVRSGGVGLDSVLEPDAVWQVVIPPDSPLYNHPGESETPKIALPGGTHVLQFVIDQLSPSILAEGEPFFNIYDADFNPSPRVANLIEILGGDYVIEETAVASATDFYFEPAESPTNGRLTTTFEIEVLVSSMPLGLYVFSPNTLSPDPFTFRVSLYVLSSTPAP